MSTSCPSMQEAAKIRDVAARHAYVFDNGLCSPDFFDVEKRMASEEFRLLRERIATDRDVLEIGCFTGLNLIGLVRTDQSGELAGIDFVGGALQWCQQQRESIAIHLTHDTYPGSFIGNGPVDAVICFDVLEHQFNVGDFIQSVSNIMRKNAYAYFLVPIGREYFDCGHVAFFPDAECLHNVLDYVFDVEELFELKTCRKLFASCKLRV